MDLGECSQCSQKHKTRGKGKGLGVLNLRILFSYRYGLIVGAGAMAATNWAHVCATSWEAIESNPLAGHQLVVGGV